MATKLINSLKDIGYEGPLKSNTELDAAVQEGPKSVEYTKLVNFLTNELRTLLNLDEQVNVISSPEDSTSFVMEVSSFLKELSCTYTSLTHGHVSDRLQSTADRLLLLDYLITELMGARILQEKKPDKKIELKLHESDEAAAMRQILMTLRFPKPPPNITVETLFQKLTPTLQNTVQKAGDELVGKPAFNGHLSDKQWEILNNVHKDLHEEYKIRREMLLTRLDVTIQSFQWSDKTKGKDKLFENVYTEKRKKLKTDPGVDLSDVLAARDEIAIIEKTSSSSVRKNTKSSLNKVIIGQVPDRGGRTSEQAPPPPEMPSWQQRTPGPSGGGHRGGGSNQSRGDYNRQNYTRGNESYNNQSSSYGSAGSYSGGQTNYNDNYHQSDRNYDSAGRYGANTYSNNNNNYNRGYYNDNRSFDSAGSYEQNSKRPKTYESFQSNRTTYADQYVQEEQHNQQYRGRGGRGGNRGGGRGRSNYQRGGRHY